MAYDMNDEPLAPWEPRHGITRVRITKTEGVSPDGFRFVMFREGELHELVNHVAQKLIAKSAAQYVHADGTPVTREEAEDWYQRWVNCFIQNGGRRVLTNPATYTTKGEPL